MPFDVDPRANSQDETPVYYRIRVLNDSGLEVFTAELTDVDEYANNYYLNGHSRHGKLVTVYFRNHICIVEEL